MTVKMRCLSACMATLAMVLAMAVPASAADGAPCQDSDKPCLLRAIRAHPARLLAGWKEDLARPLGERLAVAPASLVDYLNLDNRLNDFPERPRAAVLDAGFIDDVKGAIAGLPPALWQLFERRLAGVYFVEELGGTGFTDFVADEAGRQVAGLIVLDAGVLKKQTANAWSTWKENTPFSADPLYRLEARIETEANDNRKNAIRYILLHELGHVLSIGGNIHPPWNVDAADIQSPSDYPFFSLSWTIDRAAKRYVSLFEADFPQRRNLSYYFGAKLTAADMDATYANLQQTNFPSLYAATRPGDDFAEAFASYVHVVLQRRSWQVTITRGGELLKDFRACWDEPRCAGKRRLMEQILSSAR